MVIFAQSPRIFAWLYEVWRPPIGFFNPVIPNQISPNPVIPNQISPNPVIPMIIFGIPHAVYTFSPNSRPCFDFEFRISFFKYGKILHPEKRGDPHSPFASLQLADHLVEMLDSALAKYRTWLEKKSATRIAS